jgi:hypothetical protein
LHYSLLSQRELQLGGSETTMQERSFHLTLRAGF